MRFLERCFLWVALLSVLGCTSSEAPDVVPAVPITAEVVSDPEGLEMTLRGEVIGQAPLEISLRSFDDAVELSTSQDAPPVVERRVSILGPDRLRVTVRLGEQPSSVARKLGLSNVMIFDYGERASFDSDQYELKEEFRPMLQRQAATLERFFQGLDIYVCGHTDSVGEEDYNRLLSLQRAQAVADVLIENGIDAGRLKVQGFGPDFPVSTNETREGQALNRRTEIVLPD